MSCQRHSTLASFRAVVQAVFQLPIGTVGRTAYGSDLAAELTVLAFTLQPVAFAWKNVVTGIGIRKLAAPFLQTGESGFGQGNTRPSPPSVLLLPTVSCPSIRSICRQRRWRSSALRKPVWIDSRTAG